MNVFKGVALGLGLLVVLMLLNPPGKYAPKASQSAWWTQGTAPDIVPTCGGATSRAIPEVSGAGLALIDVNGDGVLELLIANGSTLDAPDAGPGCRLFQRTHGVWSDVTDDVELAVLGWATSATPFDLDGDGDSDVYITRIGPDVLLRNDGGRFADITAEAGIDSPAWGTAAAAGDVNGDGWTDLYIANYLHWDFDAPLPHDVRFMGVDVLAGPHGLAPQADVLYLNNGDGTFRDATVASGAVDVAPSYALNAVITDFDGDGRQDVLVGNDTMPNVLLTHAEQAGDAMHLIDTAARRGLATNADGGAQATMGLAIGDINHDGRPDVFSTNFSSDTNTLHASTPDGWFADRTQAFGLGLPSRPFLGWTVFLFDADLDGDEDLTVLNGHVYPSADMDTMDSDWAQDVLLMERDGDRFKRRVAKPSQWASAPAAHRAAVLGVLDPGLGVELVAAPHGAPIELVQHTGNGPLRRVTLQLHDGRPGIGNREGHGAHLAITDRERTQHRWITTSSPFQGASAAQVHVSVPTDAESLQVTVDWPDGPSTRHVVKLTGHDASIIVLRRSEASATARPLQTNKPIS